MSSRENGVEIETTHTSVGTGWDLVTVTDAPAKFIIRRARAEIISGSATQVALRIQRENTAYNIDTALQYDLTTGDIDSLEEVRFISKNQRSLINDTGTVYISVSCNTGTDNVVRTYIDAEIID